MSVAELQSIVLDEGQADDFRRDRYDRPLIVPVGGGKPVPYTRASSAAKVVDDTYNLELWARRNVAFGMAHDASLVARLLAVGGTPHTWTADQKKAVREIVTAAEQIAQAHKGADIGTAVHAMTEQLDRGEPVAAGPYQADLDAYRSALLQAGFETVADYVEVKIVNDELQMAGTADRILTRDGRYYIADLKTGGSIDYGALSWAAQLATYATGVLYDPTTDQRLDTPEIDRERGVIIHLPAGEGRCTLHWIDLAAGYEAARFANEVRGIRSAAKGWMTAVEMPDPALVEVLKYRGGGHADVPADMVSRAATDLRARLKATVDAGATSIAWPTGVPRFRDGGPRTWAECLAVEEAVAKVEADLGLPFPANGFLPKDPTAPLDRRPVGLPAGGGVDAAAPSSPSPAPGAPQDVQDRLKALHDALPADLRLAAHGAAMAAGIPSDRRTWTTDHLPTLERILEAATASHGERKARLASVVADLDDETFVGWLLDAVGAEWFEMPLEATAVEWEATYRTLEALTADQAEAFEALVDAYGTGSDAPVTVTFDDDGTARVVTNPGPAEAAVLAAYGGSKADALAAAKDLATLHGRPKPRSVATAASDPVLVALLIADA